MNRVDRALVLTAGIATRLRPLSLVRAKAALPLAGVPLAARILRRLAEQGVREAVLNLHHRPETIAREIGDGTGTGLRVRYSWEQPLLGSAGGPRKALPLIDADRFFLINGDTLTDVPLDAVRDTHARSGALVTMALIPNPRPDHYGGVVVRDGLVRHFTPPEPREPREPREPKEPSYHFIGIQLVEARVFAGLPDDRPTESVSAVYPALMRERADAIAAFVSGASFDDIGTPSDYLSTALRLAAAEGVTTPLLGDGCRVDPTAHVTQSVFWDRVTIEARASLSECVVADDVVVPAGSRYYRMSLVRGDDGLIAAPL